MAKEVNKRINVWLNEQGIENNLKSIRAAITKTANELNKLPIGSEEWLRKSKKLSELKNIYSEVRKEIGATEQELKAVNEQFNKNIVNAGAIGSIYAGASAAIRRFVSATQEYVDAYATLDDAMTNVSKYTGLTREEVKQLNEEFRKMDTRTPTEKLNALAADAGRLGITSKEAIKDFVEAADIINVALGEDLGEDAVKEIGKLAEMFGTTETMGLRGAMLATGSAINTLAQSSSASERYLMDFTSRLAGAANQAQISQANILGFASVLDQNKQQVEMSATALQKLLMNMFTAPEKYAHLAGMSVKEFADALKNDANEALITFLDTLNNKGGLSELAPIFKDLGLDGARASGVISVLAGKIDDVREAQATANAAFAEGNSVINEAAAVNGNAAAQLDKAKKAVQDAKAALGEELLPVITKLTQQSSNGIKVVSEVVKWMKEHQSLIKTLAAAYGILYLAHMKNVHAKELSAKWDRIVKAGESAGTVVTSLFALAKAKLAKNTLAAANAQKALKVAFAATPWGAIITAVLTLATAFSFFRNKTDEAAEAQQNLEEQITQQYNAEKKKVEDLQKIIESENSTRDQKLKAIKELKKLIPDYVAELDKEGKVVNNNKNAINDYLVALKNKIRYQSLEKALNETENKIVEARLKYNKAFDSYMSQDWKSDIWDKTKSILFGGLSKEDVMKNAGEEFNGLIEIRDEYIKEMDSMDEDLKNKTGKTYRKLYNENLLASLEGNNSPGSGGSGSGNTTDKKTLTARQNFLKKLQQMEAKEQAESLEGWEKTKQEIINKYEELLTEAKELFGENSKEVAKIQQMQTDEISTAGKKYLEKYGKNLADFSQKTASWGKEIMPDDGNEILNAMLGTEQKWAQRFTDAQNQMQDLLDLRKLFVADNIDTTAIDALIGKLEQSLNGMADMEAQDIQQTLEKYQKHTDNFIKDEKKSISDTTKTEVQKQKDAIVEKYNLEIEYIEKTIKARIAQYGEDDPELKQLREKIKILKELKNQQLDNVDKNAAKSRQKSIWQQLADFDWSKLSENWQGALDLMQQGLQEFANAAFDIYNSISQIQDNMMEAELQKAQETYDAESAALQKQLNQGVISQKAYDAKMAKMQQEKEKKEKQLKHDQFARDKTASIIQAVINGAVGITQIWAQTGVNPIVAGVLTGILAAMNALQIAAIASQPNPYAKGSYIRGPQIALMGEEGDEWVASNRLLRDKRTAGIIEALDQYQKGNRAALAGIKFNAPDTKIMSHAGTDAERIFAPSNTTNNYYQNSDNGELLKEIRMLRKYMEDPRNRQATINRNILLEYERLENSVKEMARL